ncbi:hypothetical protein [Mesorhizobium sp. M7A.F.Ca.MR.148.00.0.0]|uniref:hypothetical protein n=1 Tax=Mesorhizobium sp. M7A.F.Ca.MR.148.00.0.0 TaxID=2496775 RepID=UPI000FCB8D9C|nr:hypothetical protein [Mesorhizobium sp. M7A.F.Ca.MR.148.00.0.0]RUV33153.1 hypothetical protein EOB49_31900 [Mesorhizobium sp. M7A.F.Ca.MR.148.00.0.0]
MDIDELLQSMDGDKAPKSIQAIIDNFREDYRVIYMEFRTSVHSDRYQIANFQLSQLLVEMNLAILYILQSANLDPKRYV